MIKALSLIVLLVLLLVLLAQPKTYRVFVPEDAETVTVREQTNSRYQTVVGSRDLFAETEDTETVAAGK